MKLVEYDENARSLTDIALWWKSYDEHVSEEIRKIRGRVSTGMKSNIIEGDCLIELGVFNMLLY